jgi:hypothetical protein
LTILSSAIWAANIILPEAATTPEDLETPALTMVARIKGMEFPEQVVRKMHPDRWY